MTRPDAVERETLDFDPSRPWVYYCMACDEYVDTEDVGDHAARTRSDAHGGSARLTRVEVTQS